MKCTIMLIPTVLDPEFDQYRSLWKSVLFSPLLPEYAEQMILPICIGVINLTLDSMEVVILEFGQGLWIGNRMGKSLIHPKQCQMFRIQICNNPTNPHRKLVIEASEDLFIPMTIEGSTCGIATHPPTDDDLH